MLSALAGTCPHVEGVLCWECRGQAHTLLDLWDSTSEQLSLTKVTGDSLGCDCAQVTI